MAVEDLFLVLLTALLALLELAVSSVASERRVQKDVASLEEIALQEKIRDVSKRAEAVNAPATFTAWAKLGREQTLMERDVARIQDVRREAIQKEKKQIAAYATYARALLPLEAVLALGAAYAFGVDSSSVGVVPSSVMWPMGRLLRLPWGGVGEAFTLLSYVFACRRVAAELLY